MTEKPNNGKNKNGSVCRREADAKPQNKKLRYSAAVAVTVLLTCSVIIGIHLYVVKSAEKLPYENEQVLALAQQYCDKEHPSRKELCSELAVQCGKNADDSTVQNAADSVSANWQANALIRAMYYRDKLYTPDAKIYGRLKADGFTDEQAQYAIDNL